MMLGGARNGRAVKLTLLIGAVVLGLYFLISWRIEAQSLTKDLAIAEEEYAKIVKSLHKTENELRDSLVREANMEENLRRERQTHGDTIKAKQELEAKCMAELESKKNQVTALEGEKAELQEQIQAVKADRDSKSQEAQRLREEIHDAKEAADDEYQALSATCVQNQQTCEQRAKLNEDELNSVRSQATATYHSLQECKTQLTVQQELAGTCNARLTSLEREGASKLSEIEQIQSQLHRSEKDKEMMVEQMRHKQQNSQLGLSKLDQRENGGDSLHQLQKRYGNGGDFNNEGGNFHRGDAGVRDWREERGRSLREGADAGVNGLRDSLHMRDRGMGNQDHRIENRDNQFHGIEGNRGGYLHGIENRNDQWSDRLPDQDARHGAAKDSFRDFQITDEQKRGVYDSLQGKLARGEKLDERQLKILHLLSRYFGERKSHDQVDIPVQNGMELGHRGEQHQEAVAVDERDGLEGAKHKEEEKLPNPLDEGEEVKDLVEEQQKPGDLSNLGNDKKFDVVDRDHNELVGAGRDGLKQGGVVRENQNEERELHKKGGVKEEEGERKEKEGDNPLPKPLQHEEENLDDEDDYPGAKKEDKEEDDDMYGDHAYKRDKEQYQHEREQQKFDRQQLR